MESKIFKNCLSEVLTNNSFELRKKYFIKSTEDIICAIGIQKSNFSNSYYINVGFIIKKLHPELSNPKDIDGDIRTRFSSFEINNSKGIFDLDSFNNDDTEKIKECFKKNIEKYIDGYVSIQGLKNLLIENPTLLYQTNVKAKIFLEIIVG